MGNRRVKRKLFLEPDMGKRSKTSKTGTSKTGEARGSGGGGGKQKESELGILRQGNSVFRDRKEDPDVLLKLVHYGVSEVKEAIAGMPKDDKFDEVLTLETGKARQLDKAVREKEKAYKQESPRSKRFDPIKQVGFTMPLPAEKEMQKWYHGYPHDSARLCGFDDYYDYMRMQLYLHKNSERQLVSVRKDGNCMLTAIRRQLGIKCEEFPKDPYFPNHWLRRFIVMALVRHRDAILTKYKMFIASTYGVGDEEVPIGPFSYRTYCEAMLEDHQWGDEVMLYALALQCNLRIMMVYHPSLILYPITHMYSLRDADIVLVFNGKNHFSAAVRYDVAGKQHGAKHVISPDGKKTWVSAHRSQHPSDSEPEGYSTDEEERVSGNPRKKQRTGDGPDPARSTPAPAPAPDSAGDQVAVDRNLLKSLLETARQADTLVKRVAQATGVPIADPQPTGPLVIPQVKRGDKICPICGRKCATTTNLRRHMAQHGGQPKYTCPKCGRGLSVKRTFNSHVPDCIPYICEEMVPDTDAEVGPDGELPKKVCGQKCATPQGLQRHIAAHQLKEARKQPDYQPPERNAKCPFSDAGCTKRYKTEASLKVDHVPYCDFNPNARKRKFCPHPGCRFGPTTGYKGFRKPKDLNSHWRSHGYKQPPPPGDK